jgi:futalosine hydrolase
MKLLIVSATEMEIGPLLYEIKDRDRRTNTLVTGVGITATAYALTKHLQANTYDLVLQAGVGGAFDRSISLGDVVFVTSDQYGDLGAEDHDEFLDIFELGLLGKNTAPYAGGALINPMSAIHRQIALPQVSGLTVHTVSGNERTIKQRLQKYSCAVESMEGAAFHYVCLQEKIPFAQVRAISNYVMPRDRGQWKMKEAIINLNDWLIIFIENMG